MAHVAGTSPHRSSSPRAILTFILALAQVVTPLLPMLGIGESVGSQSDGVRTLITPAGWAFAIWGPLYFGTIVYAVYQMLPRGRQSRLIERLGWHPAAAFLGNAVWVAYTQVFGLAFPSALIIVVTLINLLAILRIFAASAGFTMAEQIAAVLPLSALAGWLTAATIVNVAATLNFHDVTLPWPAVGVSVAMLLIGGAIIALAVIRTGGNPWYPLPFLWALWAIHQQSGQQHSSIATAAIVSGAIVVVSLGVLLSSAKRRRHYLG